MAVSQQHQPTPITSARTRRFDRRTFVYIAFEKFFFFFFLFSFFSFGLSAQRAGVKGGTDSDNFKGPAVVKPSLLPGGSRQGAWAVTGHTYGLQRHNVLEC